MKISDIGRGSALSVSSERTASPSRFREAGTLVSGRDTLESTFDQSVPGLSMEVEMLHRKYRVGGRTNNFGRV
jgi:hypothetical protein